MARIFAINPGSTSTKLAYYEDENLLIQTSIEHDKEELLKYHSLEEQIPYRLEYINKFIDDNKINEIDIYVGRGGIVYGLKTGAYLVDDNLYAALLDPEKSQAHASNLGGLLVHELAKGKPAIIYDAVTSGELEEVATITGFKEINRQSFSHILNSRAQAQGFAFEIGKKYEDLNLIVGHLGGGTSFSVHKKGKVIDTVGDDDGQFSPERSGTTSLLPFADLCFSGKYTLAEVKRLIRGKGGLFAHLGTSDAREIERMIVAGDKKAKLIYQAQAYQIAKTIGLLSVSLKGEIDAIILTGGLAHSTMLTRLISEYVNFLAPVIIRAGENEMLALAKGALRILNNEEVAKRYGGE